MRNSILLLVSVPPRTLFLCLFAHMLGDVTGVSEQPIGSVLTEGGGSAAPDPMTLCLVGNVTQGVSEQPIGSVLTGGVCNHVSVTYSLYLEEVGRVFGARSFSAFLSILDLFFLKLLSFFFKGVREGRKLIVLPDGSKKKKQQTN